MHVVVNRFTDVFHIYPDTDPNIQCACQGDHILTYYAVCLQVSTPVDSCMALE